MLYLTTSEGIAIIINTGEDDMATESFSRTFKINPDWGVKNLEKALDAGTPSIVKKVRSPEYQLRFEEMTNITPEIAENMRKAYDK